MLSKRILVLVSLLLVSSFLVGCGTTPPIVDNQAPSIDSSSITTAEVGVEYTYDVEATDPNLDALTYSLTRNPDGMEIDKHTGLITWEYPTVGSFGVTVKVSDGVLSDTQSFTVTVEPVAKLTGIVVTPDPMDLEVGEIGTFTVTAHYSSGDPEDVTGACVYTLTQPITGVITVEAPLVTADGVGTDTIFISYEGKTATISVTVSGVRIPMEIIVVMPTFTVGESAWFTVTMTANDDLGEPVIAYFEYPVSGVDLIVGTLETDVGSDVTFTDTGFGFQSEFTMEDTTVNFRGTFDEIGIYGTTITVETSPGGVLLCSKDIEIVVKSAPLKVGDSYEGGKVAYILQSGDDGYDADIQHGLIVAMADQSDGIQWAIEANQNTLVPDGTLFTIGSGSANTDAIIAQHIEVDISTYAAGIARDYKGGGYEDWFLPSQDELNKLWLNKVVISGFADAFYWSSSENEFHVVWYQDFSSGNQSTFYKYDLHHVRAVRYF